MGYTRAHVLLDLLNEFRKSDKSRRLPRKLSPFLTEFNKFNNTGARMLDSVYHMTLILIKNRIFEVKTSKILSSFLQRYNGRH